MPPFLPGSVVLATALRSRSSASLNAVSGTANLVLARAGQEIGDVGVEPDVVAADAPQAERAVRILPRQQRLDGVADALIRRRIERDMRLRGEFADIEQRQRAARDLLRAAERIAIERGEQARRIERRRGADRNRDAAGAGNEIGKHVARQRHAFALGERLDRAPRQDLRRRPHRRARKCAPAQSRPARYAHPHGAVARGSGA